jgi:ELWxxDGT repeat protein
LLASASLLRDIVPGPQGMWNWQLMRVANGARAVFATDDGVHGQALWVTDGTTDGTRLLKDFDPSSPTGPEVRLVNWKGMVHAVVNFNGRTELWRTDGTSAGTTFEQVLGVDNYFETAGTTQLYYVEYATGGGRSEIWRTDGNSNVRLATLANTSAGAFRTAGDRLFFGATDPATGADVVWTSDGTPQGTIPLKTFLRIDYLVTAGNLLFFQGEDSAHGQELWRSDGTAAGTQLVVDLWPGPESSHAGTDAVAVGQNVFFRAFPPDGRRLFVSDGTATGTVAVTTPAGQDVGTCWDFFAADGWLYFAEDLANLWRTDGTPAATTYLGTFDRLADFDRGSFGLTSDGHYVYFAAQDLEHGNELWRTDGTEAGTSMVADVAPGAASSNPDRAARVNRRLVFFASTKETGREPFVVVKEFSSTLIRPAARVEPDSEAGSPDRDALDELNMLLN